MSKKLRNIHLIVACICRRAGAKRMPMKKRKRRRRMRWKRSPNTNFRPIANRCGFTCTFSSASGLTNRHRLSISVPLRPALNCRKRPTIGSCTSSFFKTEAPRLTTHFRGKPIHPFKPFSRASKVMAGVGGNERRISGRPSNQ